MASYREKLPNLKICLDNTEDDNDIEEELSLDDNISDEDDIVVQPEIVADEDPAENVEFSVKLTGVQSDVKQKPKFQPEFPKKYENKAGNFITGIDITSKEALEKKKERAQRFGLPVTDEEEAKINLTALYTSLGIKEGELHKDERGIRLEAIHLRGTDDMSTQDVFKYFGDFAPGAVEWIDDSSCNVVWLDTVTAARAMIKLSHSDETANNQLEERRKARKLKSSSLDKERPKLEDVEMVEATGLESQDVLKRSDDSTDRKPEAADVASEEQKMEVEEDDDELDLCADDDPKPKQPSESVVTAEEPPQPPPPLEQRKKVLDDESDSGVEDNPSDRDDEDDDDDDGIENHSDQDTSSSKRTQNDVKTRTDGSTVKNNTVEDTFTRTKRPIPWPPGKWRLGINCPKARFLFMRFATKADKKIPGAEKKSRYYQKYGNPNYGGLKGLISGTRKRKYRYNQYKDEIDEAHDAVVSHRLAKTNADAVGSADEEPEDGEIVDSGDEEDITVGTKISPLNRIADNAKEREKDKEDELDLDAELEQLLGSPPKKRMMRMYADDEEEQIKAKRIARSGIFTVTTDIPDSKTNKASLGKIKDARELIKQAALRPKFTSNSSHLGSNDLRARLLNKRKRRSNYNSASEEDDLDDDNDSIVRTDLRSRLTVNRKRGVESPSSSYSFPTAQRVTKTGWSELSRSDSGRNGRTDESGGRTLIKYESDSDDDVVSDVVRKSGRGRVRDDSESSSSEQDSRTMQKLRTKSSDSYGESDMSGSDEDVTHIRSSDLRSRLGNKRKPNKEYPSMRIEVLD